MFKLNKKAELSVLHDNYNLLNGVGYTPPPNTGCHSKNLARLDHGLAVPRQKNGLR
jgi:hypothetical protein